jgi:hypothetical protein
MTPEFHHVIRRTQKPCRIVARGALASIAVELQDGELIVTTRRAIARRPRPQPTEPMVTQAQLQRIAIIAAPHGWDHEDVLYLAWERRAIPWLQSLSELTERQADALIASLGTPIAFIQ